MIKYIVVIGVIWAIYFFFIKKKPTIKKVNQEKETSHSNDMIQCSSCKIYCEIDDSILSLGKYYCSDECIKKG